MINVIHVPVARVYDIHDPVYLFTYALTQKIISNKLELNHYSIVLCI